MTPRSPLPPFARYAWAVLAANVGVVLWGAFVRATGSGAGCGSHWPRCDGRVIPRLASTEQVIEFTHRATSGAALLLVLALLVWAWRAWPRGHVVRLGAALSMALMLTEALVGAGLVLLELVAGNRSVARVYWMAAHLANTFFLLGALTLTAWWASGGGRPRLRGQGAAVWLVAGAVAATLLVGITGAVTALGDTLFPKTAVGVAVSSTAHVLERLRVVHPLLAVATAVYAAAAAWGLRRLRPGPATDVLARLVVALFAVQLAAGAVNVALLAPVWMQIVHLLLADAVWIALVLMGAAALAAPVPARVAVPSPAPPAGAPALG